LSKYKEIEFFNKAKDINKMFTKVEIETKTLFEFCENLEPLEILRRSPESQFEAQ
jgi:hypothetical protein